MSNLGQEHRNCANESRIDSVESNPSKLLNTQKGELFLSVSRALHCETSKIPRRIRIQWHCNDISCLEGFPLRETVVSRISKYPVLQFVESLNWAWNSVGICIGQAFQAERSCEKFKCLCLGSLNSKLTQGLWFETLKIRMNQKSNEKPIQRLPYS